MASGDRGRADWEAMAAHLGYSADGYQEVEDQVTRALTTLPTLESPIPTLPRPPMPTPDR